MEIEQRDHNMEGGNRFTPMRCLPARTVASYKWRDIEKDTHMKDMDKCEVSHTG